MTLQQRLGIEFPVVQAPMAGGQNSAMAIAVCEAGGLGSLPAAMYSTTTLREQLEQIAAQTRRPYNVNFFCHAEPVVDAEREARWRQALAPYYREYGIDSAALHTSPLGPAPSRAPFNAAMLDVLRDFKPAVVSFHFGLPAPALLAGVKNWGATVMASATTVAEARWLAAHGADVVIAQGLEAGGHRGHFLTQSNLVESDEPGADLATQLGTLALLPQIVRAVNIPVLAAGGIVDAATVAAAQALGAAGVQSGTAYLLCPEATISAVYRAALIAAAASSTATATTQAANASTPTHDAAHTALTNLFTGRPARGLMNRLMRELGPLSAVPPPFPLASAAIGPLRSGAEKQQRGDFSPLWCGQNASGCREVPAAQITRELAQGWR
jgi:nitronate monooxygenase